MKKHHIHLVFLLLLFLWTGPAKAELVSSVDLNFGVSSLSLKASDFSKALTSSSTLEVNYVLKHSGPSLAYLMTFTEMLSGEGRQLPFSMFSAGVRYYTSGFNGSRLVLDQGVAAKVWRATPFLGLNLGLANISIDEMNASVIDISPRVGVELPITPTVLGQAQLVLQAGSASGTTSESAISYSGVSAFLGIVIVGF